MAEEVLYKSYLSSNDYYMYYPLKKVQYTSQKYSFDFSTEKHSIEASNLNKQYHFNTDLNQFVISSSDANSSIGMNNYINRGFVNGFAIVLSSLDSYGYNQRTEALVNANEIILPQEIGETVSGELTYITFPYYVE